MIYLTLQQLAKVVGGQCFGANDIYFRGVAIDSRNVLPGQLFVALKGERVDGHHFLEQAKTSGAVAALVGQKMDVALPQVVVPNTLRALGEMGAFWGRHCGVAVLGVTGSNGKSTVKNMIAAILQADHRAHWVTRGNLNTDVGLPLMLCQVRPEHQYAVLEMGMSHVGEIAYLSRLAQPLVAVITNAYPSHLAGVGDTVEGVARAKGEIFQGLQEQGYAVLNRDDVYYAYWKDLLKSSQKVVAFGFQPEVDVRAEDIVMHAGTVSFVLCARGESIAIQLPLPGKHNVANALAAAAVCAAIGVSVKAIQEGLRVARAEKHRMERMVTPEGAQLIDDSYNANPASFQAALDVLAASEGVRAVVLGDMKELGTEERVWHVKIGEYAKTAGIEYLLGIGDLAQEAVQAFGAGAQHFSDKRALLAVLRPMLSERVTVLVKGSRSMRLDEIVTAVMEGISFSAKNAASIRVGKERYVGGSG